MFIEALLKLCLDIKPRLLDTLRRNMYLSNRHLREIMIFNLQMIFFSMGHVNFLSTAQGSSTKIMWNTCGDPKSVFLRFLDLSVNECVTECAIRPDCKALDYRSRLQFCELLKTDDEIQSPAQCDHIKKSAIDMSKVPCNSCSSGEACDLSRGRCILKECTAPVVVNGTLFGNNFTPGRKIRLRCDTGYKEANGVVTAVCQEGGSWSQMLSCVPNETPDSENTGSSCQSINLQLANDSWCDDNCNHNPPHCPDTHCSCS